jgi:hypothetical protein
MLAGNYLWKRGAQAYQLAGVGGRSYHPSMLLPHATKTEQSAFMSVYLWAGDLSKKQYSYDGDLMNNESYLHLGGMGH